MKDYSINDFQKQTFITSYDVDPSDNTIMINYADKKNDMVPYSIDQEKSILKMMRSQVLNGEHFYNKVKEGFKKLDFKRKIYMVLNAIYLGLIIGLAIRSSIIYSLIFILITVPHKYLDYKRMKKVKSDYKLLKESLDDYEKSLAFVENAEVFSNKKIMKPRVINKTSDKVKFIISAGIITDKYKEIKREEGKVPYVTFRLINEHNLIEDPVLREKSIEDERESIESGYEDVSGREIPFLNENTIDYLSYRDLSKLYSLSKQDNRGKVLVKVKNIEWKR